MLRGWVIAQKPIPTLKFPSMQDLHFRMCMPFQSKFYCLFECRTIYLTITIANRINPCQSTGSIAGHIVSPSVAVSCIGSDKISLAERKVSPRPLVAPFGGDNYLLRDRKSTVKSDQQLIMHSGQHTDSYIQKSVMFARLINFWA